MCSRHFTIASGVHGMIDFTVPGGAWSESDGPVLVAAGAAAGEDESRDCGWRNRMLNNTRAKGVYERERKGGYGDEDQGAHLW